MVMNMTIDTGLYMKCISGRWNDIRVDIDRAKVNVTIETRHFESLTKTATFKTEANHSILLHNLRSYVAEMPADEVIYYYFVPQKKNARVEFSTYLGQVYRDNPGTRNYDETFTDALGTYYVDYVTPNVDEFLLYSENLEHSHPTAESIRTGWLFFLPLLNINLKFGSFCSQNLKS